LLSFTFAPPPCLALISPELPLFIMDIELHPIVSLLPETFSEAIILHYAPALDPRLWKLANPGVLHLQ